MSHGSGSHLGCQTQGCKARGCQIAGTESQVLGVMTNPDSSGRARKQLVTALSSRLSTQLLPLTTYGALFPVVGR